MADLIERKDALAKLIALRKDNAEYSCENDIMRGKDMAYENAMDIIARIPAINRWISAEDALPEQDGTYLVYIDSGEVFSCTFESGIEDESKFGFWHPYYDSNTLGYIDSEWHPIETVTHWMPMSPEPPEKE